MADDRKFIDKNNATAIDPLERHDDTRANSTGIIGIHRGQAARPDPRPIIPRVRRSGGPSLYRRRVPRDLVARFGRSEISLTLGDCGSRESARRAAELDVGVMRMFAAARAYPELSEADLARLVDAFIVRTKASWRAMSAWPDLREQSAVELEMAAVLRRATMDRQPLIDPDVVAELCRELGIVIPRGSPIETEVQRLLGEKLAGLLAANARERLRAENDATAWEAEAASARRPGLWRSLRDLWPGAREDERAAPAAGVEPPLEKRMRPDASSAMGRSDATFTALSNHAPRWGVTFGSVTMTVNRAEEPAKGVAAAPTPSAPPPVDASDGWTDGDRVMSAAWARFTKSKIETERVWAESRRPELASTIRLFTWIIGDKDVRTVTARDLVIFKEKYLQLPKNYKSKLSNSTKRKRRPTVDAVINNINQQKSVSAKTFNKHASNLRAFGAYCITCRLTPQNSGTLFDAGSVAVKKRNAGRGERKAYSTEQARKIFALPVFTGRASKKSVKKPGRYVVRNALYWVPIISALALMRAGEITQLRGRHVKKEGEIWFFDLTADDLNLKEEDGDDPGSPRRVPVHRGLIDLGFIDTVVAPRSDRPDELLFPELTKDPRTGSYATKVLKNFQYLARSVLGEDDDRTADFGLHPMRHWGITALATAAGDHVLKDELSGHSSDERFTERRRYTKLELLLDALKVLIDQIDPPMDIARMVAAAAASPASGDTITGAPTKNAARRVKKVRLTPRISRNE